MAGYLPPRQTHIPRLWLRSRSRTLQYRMSYLGAMCEWSYLNTKKRPSRDFHYGGVIHHHMFAIRTS